MNEFRDTYQHAVADIKTVHIDVDSVLDEGRRKRLKKRRAGQKAVTFLAVLCILAVGSFGSVQAAEYVKSIIRVNESGFSSADPLTASLNEEMAIGGGTAAFYGIDEEALEETLTLADDEMVIEQYQEAEVVEADPTIEYDSVAEFQKAENAVFALPDMALLGEEIDSQHVWVSGMFISIRLESGEKSVFFDRMDYTGSEGHASSTVYSGGVCNERTFKTGQGYEYILVDSSGKETVNIYTAITVGNYELYADFYGYEEREVKQILESIDLTVYEP